MFKNEFKLIDGTFEGPEANELISTLFTDKMRFHNIKNLSHLERFGKPDVQAEKRIQSLKGTLDEVSKFLKSHGQTGNFEIHANITIKPVG